MSEASSPRRSGSAAHGRLAIALAGSLLVVGFVLPGTITAQKNPYRNYTEEKFVQNMQTAGRNYAAVTDLLAKRDYEAAKAQLTRAREQLAITVTLWRDRSKEDAITMLRTALDRTDALDAVLSSDSLDAAAIGAAAERLTASCQACHAVYRDQDPATKAYRVKPGSIADSR